MTNSIENTLSGEVFDTEIVRVTNVSFMGLIKESKKVDLIIKSEPWTEKELKEFRKVMKAKKTKRKKHPLVIAKRKTKQNT